MDEPEITPEQAVVAVNFSATVGLGWVTNGVVATNEQLLVKDVYTCTFFVR